MANLKFDFLHSYETGERRESEPANAYQYDEGHVLEAVLPEAVTSCEIHYWIRGQEKSEAYTPGSITQNDDGSCTVIGNIPNLYFETNGELRVYIVVTDGDASITTYEGYVHICQRSMPDDYVDDDPENEATRVLIEAQTAAATATAAAETCEEVLESIPEDYSQLSEDVDTLKDGLTAVESDVTDLKADLAQGNFNQRVKINPFVIGTSSVNREIGAVMGNRSALEIITNGIKATRNTVSPTFKTFGLTVYMDEIDPGNSGHKIYVSISNLALSGNATFQSWLIYGSHRGTTQGIANTYFTDSNYKNILTLSADVAEFNVSAVTVQPATTTDYFTLGSIQIIDLTQMFGAGYEPTVEGFEAIYSDAPYSFNIPTVQTDTRGTKVLINNEISKLEVDYEIINNIADMTSATKDKVLVLHNDSQYGDGGPCWFEYLGYATEYGYARADGGKMYPMLDQGALLPSAPPVKNIMSLVSSYVENSNLVYGQTNGLFDTTTTNNIDCSSFVNAVLHGISYFTSKYVVSANKSMSKVCSYDPDPSYTFGYASTRQMAQYFAEQKTLYKMPTSEAMRRILSVGDIIFTGSGLEEFENRFLKIDHVFIVLALLDNNRVVIAQCGSCPTAITERNNSSTVGKISTIILSNENIATYCKAFARPAYINAFNSACTGLNLKPSLVPNVYVNTSGAISSSGLASATPEFIEVIPESVISFTGTKTKDNISYFTLVTEYDQGLQFISRTDFTNNNITLGATTRYIRITYGHSSSGDGAMTLKETNLFEATLTIPTV